MKVFLVNPDVANLRGILKSINPKKLLLVFFKGYFIFFIFTIVKLFLFHPRFRFSLQRDELLLNLSTSFHETTYIVGFLFIFSILILLIFIIYSLSIKDNYLLIKGDEIFYNDKQLELKNVTVNLEKKNFKIEFTNNRPLNLFFYPEKKMKEIEMVLKSCNIS